MDCLKDAGLQIKNTGDNEGVAFAECKDAGQATTEHEHYASDGAHQCSGLQSIESFATVQHATVHKSQTRLHT